MLTLLPLDINKLILSFLKRPARSTILEIRNHIKCIYFINKEIYSILKLELPKLKRIYELVCKYKKYNSEYEDNIHWRTKQLTDYGGNPQLWDALCSSCMLPYAYSTFNYFNEETTTDITDLLVLTPESIKCTIGYLRCRSNVHPLVMACLNPVIPINIVELLLIHGADINQTYLINGQETNILEDISITDVYSNRYNEIVKLFEKYKKPTM